jgi:hypothetical protein
MSEPLDVIPGTNDFYLHYYNPDFSNSSGIKLSRFKLSEFENSQGIVVINNALIFSLECFRTAIAEKLSISPDIIKIVITDGTRTEEDNQALGKKLGWTDEGGLVSRDSKHLTKYGGIAADIVVLMTRARIRIPHKVMIPLAEQIFDYAKSYHDGHLHVDMRGILKQKQEEES